MHTIEESVTLPSMAAKNEAPTRLNVFISIKGKEKLQKQADAKGVSLSEFIRLKLGDTMKDRRPSNCRKLNGQRGPKRKILACA